MKIFEKIKARFEKQATDTYYEFPFISLDMMTSDLPQRPTTKMVRWLHETNIGKWEYIYEMGDLWGVRFYNEVDAAAFKLKWTP